jgi:hypothetical protein
MKPDERGKQMDEKSRQIVRDFFTEEEWDVIHSALVQWWGLKGLADSADKLTDLWADSFAEERRHWNAVQP